MRYSEKHVDMRTGSLYKIYDFASAILRAAGNSRYPFFALALSGIGNVILNIMIPCAHRCEKFPPYCTKLLIYYLLVIKSCASP